MLRLRDQAKRIGDFRDGHDSMWKRREGARCHATEDPRHERSDEIVLIAHDLREIDDKHRQAVLERSQSDTRVLIDVALADLEKTAVWGKSRKPLADRLSGQRIQHQID